MSVTPFTNIPVPSEDEDPFFDTFTAMVDDMDLKFYGILQSVGNILVPSPGLSWDAANGIFSWTGDFIMPVLSSNFQLTISFGPDLATRQFHLNDGDKVVIASPVSAGANVTAHFEVVPGALAYQAGLFVFGTRIGQRFYCNLPTTF